MADHPRVGQRRRKRWRDLQALGYRNYAEYLKSAHWSQIKALYWLAAEVGEVPSECVCGERDGLQLHHKTYDRIGQEELADLAPLCCDCHACIHVLERRGDLGLDLQGLTDAERAFLYRVQATGLRERAEAEAPPDLDGKIALATQRRNEWKRDKNRFRRQRQRSNRRLK